MSIFSYFFSDEIEKLIFQILNFKWLHSLEEAEIKAHQEALILVNAIASWVDVKKG